MTRKFNTKEDFKGEPSKTRDNLDFLIKLTEWKNSEKIDIFDPNQLKQRLNDYMYLARDCGTSPTVSDLEIVLGIPRQYIYMVLSGNYRGHTTLAKLPTECVNAIKDTYHIILGSVEKGIATGAMNPVSGIFLAKSMGIKDTNDVFDSQVEKENTDFEQLKTQYLNQLPDKNA